ncbi:L-alanine-DL-glutamate epimerase-like enolase superfamily enzyme [Sphingomonas endophytica]|uniref:L-rhamnonate dehydratase n=1 Tax=Sphingomonas endophytica TaxID=869719 RepID=A0A7X0JDI9_9SPHN|nr:L-rhamnonate dehydratase [Sphingomonas endophytica]MBB6505658.1 L-alanine-DL-glutamate epimerase-like enolase superfamily enzyme [Sphingomonas endophytica]
MKITEVRTRVVQWKGQTQALPPHFCTNPMDAVSPMLSRETMGSFTFHGWLIVEVFTDKGLVGIGNAALAPMAAKALVDGALAPLILGHDPWDTEFLWQHMYRKTMAFGRKGVVMAAISAIDIALWDLMGKDARQPCFRLMGGRTRPRIPVYASRLYSVPLDELAAEATRYKAQGFRAMKLRFGWGPDDGAAGMARNVALVRTVREAVGDEIDVMADAYMGWSLDYAKRMMRLIEPFNLRWLEEAIIPDDIHGYHELRRFGTTPIAAGEHEFTSYGFRQLIEARALDYIQFDTNRVGGLTAARKIQALAEAYSIPVVPHAGQMHNYHVVMASLNSPIAEYFPKVDVEVGNELFWYVFKGEPVAEDGYVSLSDDVPGLGLEIDEAALANFEVTA